VSWGLTTRRSFLGAAAAGTGALLLGRDPSSLRAQSARLPLIRGARFTQGVASGQQSPAGFTAWTKLSGVERTARLQIEVSRDEDFRSVLYRQNVVAGAEHAFAVHHRVEHPVIRPGEQYFYRFSTCDENSPVGRCRTARPADSQEPVRIGFWSCQAFEAGFYTAHQGLANEPDLDVVVCLGDYIYERPFYDSGGVRSDRTGANGDGEVETLAEYREKYALYHSDPRLLEMRRVHPTITIWDDHEVEDNYARDEPGHATLNRRLPFGERRANAYRAFFEHMPRLRVPEERDRTYGSIRLGANAELFLLDERQYRDVQPCGDEFFVPCPEADDPARTMLGAAQKQWLKAGLASSSAAWKVVANQVMMMALDGPPRNVINKDQWDGYGGERREILEHVAATGTRDVAFVTGDIHTFFAGEVTPTGRTSSPADPPPVATEFIGGSVTSEGILPEAGREGSAVLVNSAILANNPHIRFVDQERKGYGVVECDAREMRVRLRAARTVKAQTSDVHDLARFRVERGTPRVLAG
jgi:alkaline phosphatase D